MYDHSAEEKESYELIAEREQLKAKAGELVSSSADTATKAQTLSFADQARLAGAYVCVCVCVCVLRMLHQLIFSYRNSFEVEEID